MGLYQRRKYINRFDKRGCHKMSKESIELFIKEAESRGWKCTKADDKDDMFGHWDIMIAKKKISKLIEVKGLKRIDSTKDLDDSLILIEYTNVSGDIGWVRGISDYVAFLVKEGFVFVPTTKLRAYSEKVINWSAKPIPSPQNKKAYVVYQRSQWGQKDLFAYVTKDEIMALKMHIWKIGENDVIPG